MKKILKQIAVMCLISGLVNQSLTYGRVFLSPCGVNECSMNIEQIMKTAGTSTRHEGQTVDSQTLASRLVHTLAKPVFGPEEIEAIRERIQNEPRTIRSLNKKFWDILNVDFSSKLVRYILIAALVTAVIDQVTKLCVVYTFPRLSGGADVYEVYRHSFNSIRYTINWEYGRMPDNYILLTSSLFKSWLILGIVSMIKKLYRRHIIWVVFAGLYIGGGLSNGVENFFRGGAVDWIPGCINSIPNLADFAGYVGFYGLLRHNIKFIVRIMQRFDLSRIIRKGALPKDKTIPFMLLNTKFDEYVRKFMMWIILAGIFIYSERFPAVIVIAAYESISLCIRKMPVRRVTLPNPTGVSHLATSN